MYKVYENDTFTIIFLKREKDDALTISFALYSKIMYIN